MEAADAIKTILAFAALILAAPVIALIVRVSVFFGGLKRAVESLDTAAKEFTRTVTRKLEENAECLNEHETRISVLEHKAGVSHVARLGEGRRAGDGQR